MPTHFIMLNLGRPIERYVLYRNINKHFNPLSNKIHWWYHQAVIWASSRENLTVLHAANIATYGVILRIQRWGDRGPDPPPLRNHKGMEFLSKNGPDPLSNHKGTKTAFNVGASSARQRNAI